MMELADDLAGSGVFTWSQCYHLGCHLGGLTHRKREMSDLDVETRTPTITTDEGDHERFAHYVIGGSEAILNSMVTGEPVTALCGKVWVPSRDPERFPVCPDCKRIKEENGW